MILIKLTALPKNKIALTMPKPGENKTFQRQIITYAQEMGWKFVSRDEADTRRGFNNHNGSISANPWTSCTHTIDI